MNVVYMVLQIHVITNLMFPKPALPNTLVAFVYFARAAVAGRQVFRKCTFNDAPA